MSTLIYQVLAFIALLYFVFYIGAFVLRVLAAAIMAFMSVALPILMIAGAIYLVYCLVKMALQSRDE